MSLPEVAPESLLLPINYFSTFVVLVEYCMKNVQRKAQVLQTIMQVFSFACMRKSRI